MGSEKHFRKLFLLICINFDEILLFSEYFVVKWDILSFYVQL